MTINYFSSLRDSSLNSSARFPRFSLPRLAACEGSSISLCDGSHTRFQQKQKKGAKEYNARELPNNVLGLNVSPRKMMEKYATRESGVCLRVLPTLWGADSFKGDLREAPGGVNRKGFVSQGQIYLDLANLADYVRPFSRVLGVH